MFGLGIWELLAIFMVILLLFGAKRLPEIGGTRGGAYGASGGGPGSKAK